MNNEIARILRDRLRLNGGLSFVQKYAGIARTVVKEVPLDGEATKRTRFPVSTETFIDNQCLSNEEIMTPDSSVRGVLYFEDNGVQASGRSGSNYMYISTVTLVCWINRAMVVSNIYDEISAIAINEIVEKLGIDKNPVNEGMFIRMTSSITKIAPQEAAIFSKYTYDEAVTQYLRPPFEFFALTIQTKFAIRPDCVNTLTPIDKEVCY